MTLIFQSIYSVKASALDPLTHLINFAQLGYSANKTLTKHMKK